MGIWQMQFCFTLRQVFKKSNKRSSGSFPITKFNREHGPTKVSWMVIHAYSNKCQETDLNCLTTVIETTVKYVCKVCMFIDCYNLQEPVYALLQIHVGV